MANIQAASFNTASHDVMPTENQLVQKTVEIARFAQDLATPTEADVQIRYTGSIKQQCVLNVTGNT